jgi:hypothetical protein
MPYSEADDIADWLYQAEMSDFCQEGDMRKPTRQMVKETIAFLKANNPNWREVCDNAFAILSTARYPQFQRQGSS